MVTREVNIVNGVVTALQWERKQSCGIIGEETVAVVCNSLFTFMKSSGVDEFFAGCVHVCALLRLA